MAVPAAPGAGSTGGRRRAAWPARHAPGGMLAAAVAVALAAALVALAHRPTAGQRAADLARVIQSVGTGLQSCAGGLRDSLTALRAIELGTSRDVATAVSIAHDGAANCSPANNQQLADLAQYQVPESLASFHLAGTINDLVTWAFPWAQRVQQDIVNSLLAATASARNSALTTLRADQRELDSLRGRADAALSGAARAFGPHHALPTLPG